jgi:CRP/FNR family cyclic AMP-dependent transcriptional regulator
MELPEATGSKPRLVEPPVTVALLREVGLFGALSDEVLARFATVLPTETFAPGQVVFHEGEAAHCLYLLLDGEVEVLKRSHTSHEHRVAILGPGDCFGEMSLIDVQPRSATVRSIAPSRVLRVSSEDFDRLYRQDLKSYALVVLNVARDLSRRLRVADAILADVAGSVADRYGKSRG